MDSQGLVERKVPKFYIYKEYKVRKLEENNNKKFKCPYPDCHKPYNHKNKMLAHLRTHYGIKPFNCSFCGKAFNEKGNLKTHLRIHTGERPYHCNLCPKAFKAFGQLRDHLTSHTGIKPFQCPICQKFYRRKGILKNHMLIHSNGGDKKLSCIYCCNNFKDSCQLNQHIMSHLSSRSTNQSENFLSAESTSQYSSSISSENWEKNEEDVPKNLLCCNEMFNMLQRDIGREFSPIVCYNGYNGYNGYNVLGLNDENIIVSYFDVNFNNNELLIE